MKKVFSIMAVSAMMLFAGKSYAQLTLNLGYAPVTYTTTINNNDSKMEMNGFFVGANYNVNLMSLSEPTSASTPRPTRVIFWVLPTPRPPRPRC